jgi:hypothetical protein
MREETTNTLERSLRQKKPRPHSRRTRPEKGLLKTLTAGDGKSLYSTKIIAK